MDRTLPKRPARRALRWSGLALGTAVLGYGLWFALPHGLAVPASSAHLATATRGVFRDEVAVRSTAQALHSTVLDAVAQGRVEEVFAKDGSLVKSGDLLFRMSNPQLRIELLQRQSEEAQLLSNISNFRVSFDAARSEAARRMDTLKFDEHEAQKQLERNEELAAQGFIAATVLRDSRDKRAKLQRDITEEGIREARAATTRDDTIARLEQAAKGIRSGIRIVTENLDGLAVRAPVSGRLTDFHLQVGESVHEGERTGRIDEPGGFKLAAVIDEYYLSRISLGRRGSAQIDGKAYPVEVHEVFSQVKDGRFTADLTFPGDAPAELSPGQSVDLAITMGEPAPALVIPSGNYLNESGGTWVYVVDASGASAKRRTIRLGRRNNAQAEVLSGLNEGERIIVSSYGIYGSAVQLQLAR